MNQYNPFGSGLLRLLLVIGLVVCISPQGFSQFVWGKRVKVSDRYQFVGAITQGDSAVALFRAQTEGVFTGDMQYIRFRGVEAYRKNDSLTPFFPPGNASRLWATGATGVVCAVSKSGMNKTTKLWQTRYAVTHVAGFPEPAATPAEQEIELTASRRMKRHSALAPVYGKDGRAAVRMVGNSLVAKEKRLSVRYTLFDADGSAEQIAEQKISVAKVHFTLGSRSFATANYQVAYTTVQAKAHQDMALLYMPKIEPRYRNNLIEPALYFRKGMVSRFSFADGTLMTGAFAAPVGKAYTRFYLIPSARGNLIGTGLCTLAGKDSLLGIDIHVFTPNLADGTLEGVQGEEIHPFYAKAYPYARQGFQRAVELAKQFDVKTLSMQDGTGDVVITLERKYEDIIGTLYAGYVRVYRISPAGQLRWSVMIPKKQSLAAIRADFASFMLYEEKGEVVLLYNDQEGNLDEKVTSGRENAMSLIVPRHQGGCVVKAILSPQGELRREVLFPAVEAQKISSMLYTAAGFVSESPGAKWVLLVDRTPNVGSMRMARIPVKQ